jgi:hypothetical protein
MRNTLTITLFSGDGSLLSGEESLRREFKIMRGTEKWPTVYQQISIKAIAIKGGSAVSPFLYTAVLKLSSGE